MEKTKEINKKRILVKRSLLKTHERKVENFYSTGIKKKSFDHHKIKKIDHGFLSFGYWEQGTKSYLEAAYNLLNFFIENGKINKADRILNVACGYGTETFVFYEKYKPKLIEGVEITKIHVDIANGKAKELGLADKIKFKYGDACELDYPEESFSCILGIEGPAHFNPREKFFYAARKVLESKGVLLITDIILGEKFKWGKKFQVLLLRIVANVWVYPKINWMDEKTYKATLKKAGLKLISLKKIGDKVFPGFAKNCLKIESIKTRFAHRGFFCTLGLSIISFLLGFVHKKGLIEYIFVKAQKL